MAYGFRNIDNMMAMIMLRCSEMPCFWASELSKIINFTSQDFRSGMFLYLKIKKYDILKISRSKMIIWR